MIANNAKKPPMVATTVLVAAISVLVFGTATDAFATTPTYNPDVTDWWGDMIEALGDKSSTTWTEPGWSDELRVEIESIGTDTYRVSLYGIAASGNAISYTITETENGYHKYGPEKEDGGMYSDTYVTSLDDIDGDVQARQPIKPSHLIVRDSRTGQGDIGDSGKHCWLSDGSWFSGTVSDHWKGSKVNYAANNDAYDRCSKPLEPDDVDLAWKNGSYKINVWGTDTSNTVYFYTPSPDGKTTFQMRVNWR
ncbi:MAG: hypothetical protein OXI27_07775 [Thaumarchaeota archaeon]|nr:hypothetical protein [Nitrososphaerota archaeon]